MIDAKPDAAMIERATQWVNAPTSTTSVADTIRSLAELLATERALALEETVELYAFSLESEADKLRQSSAIDRHDGFDDVARATDKDAEVWEAAARCIRTLATPKATEDQT